MDFIYSCHTDTGRKRKQNQDACAVRVSRIKGGTLLMAVVCDGMGGLSLGEVASAQTIKRLLEWYDNELPGICNADEDFKELLFGRWRYLINEINKDLVDLGKRNESKLGTTLSCLLFYKDKYYVCHVGDSRIYMINDHAYQITNDQSFVAREVREGRMTIEEAGNDSRNNILLQCVGAMEVGVEPEFRSGYALDGTVYLICSDGFWHKISNQELQHMFRLDGATDEIELKNKLIQLTETAMDRGEKDNITALVIKITDGIKTVDTFMDETLDSTQGGD